MAPQSIITRPSFFKSVSPYSRRFREIVIVTSVFILLIIWIDYSYNYAERNSNHIPLTKSRRNRIRENGAPETMDNSFNRGKYHRRNLSNIESRRHAYGKQGLTNLLGDPDLNIVVDDDGKDEKIELVAKKMVTNSNIGENKLHSKHCVCPTLKPDKVKLTGVVDERPSDKNLQHKPYDLKMICKNYSADRSNDRIFPNQSLIMKKRNVIYKASISCLIIPYSQYDFDLLVKPTWVKKCKNYFSEQRKEILGLSQEKKYLEKLNKKNPEWVVVSNCQNFLVMENLQFFLHKFSPSQRLVFQVTDSVFILSNAAMRKAVNNFDSPNCGKENTLFKCLNGSMKIYSLKKDSMYEPISIAMRREKSIQSYRMPLLIKNTPPHQMHTIEFMIYNMHLKEIYQSGRTHTLEPISPTEEKAETEQINIKSDSVVRPDTEDNKNQIPNSLSLRQKLKRDGNIRRTEKDKGETQEVNIKNGGVIRSDTHDENRTLLSLGHQSKRDGNLDIRRTEVIIGKAKVNIKPGSEFRSDTGDNKVKTPISLSPVQQSNPDKDVNIRKTEEGEEEPHANIKSGSDVRPDTDDNEDQIPTALSPRQKLKRDGNIRRTEKDKGEAQEANIKNGGVIRSDTEDKNRTLLSPGHKSKRDGDSDIRSTEVEIRKAKVNIKSDSDVRPDTDGNEDQIPNPLSPRQKLKRDRNIRRTEKDKGETQEAKIKNGGVIRSNTRDKNRTLFSPGHKSKRDVDSDIRRAEVDIGKSKVNIKSVSDARPDIDDNENQTPTSLSRVQQYRRSTNSDIHRTHNHQTHVVRRENFPALVQQKGEKTIKGIQRDNIVIPLSEKKSIEKFKELIEENVSKNIKLVPANTLE